MLKLNIIPDMAMVLENLSKISSELLIAEIKLLKHSTDKNIPNGTTNKSVFLWLDWLNECERSNTFHNFYNTLKMFSILPVTSCTCEPVFSKLNIVKNNLRNTMKQDRLEALLCLFTEQEMASNVNKDIVINEFNNLSKRRMTL